MIRSPHYIVGHEKCSGSVDPDLDNKLDPYGEIQIRIQDTYGKCAKTCHGKKLKLRL